MVTLRLVCSSVTVTDWNLYLPDGTPIVLTDSPNLNIYEGWTVN